MSYLTITNFIDAGRKALLLVSIISSAYVARNVFENIFC